MFEISLNLIWRWADLICHLPFSGPHEFTHICIYICVCVQRARAALSFEFSALSYKKMETICTSTSGDSKDTTPWASAMEWGFNSNFSSSWLVGADSTGIYSWMGRLRSHAWWERGSKLSLEISLRNGHEAFIRPFVSLLNLKTQK